MQERMIFISFPIDELKEIIGEVVKEQLKVLQQNLISDQKIQKTFITIEETCQLLKINKVTLWCYSKDGKLKQYRIGRRVFYLSEEIGDALMHKGQEK